MFEGVQDDQFRQFLAPIRNSSGVLGRIPTANPNTTSVAAASINLHLPPHPLSFSLFDGSSDGLSVHQHHPVHHLPPHHHHSNINSPIPTSNSIEYPIFEPNLPPAPQPRVLPPPPLHPIHHHHHMNSGTSNIIQQPFVMHLQFPNPSDSQISSKVVAAIAAGSRPKHQQEEDEEEDHHVIERSCTSNGFLSTSLGLQRERSSSSSASSSSSSPMVLPAAASSDSLIMSRPWSNEEVISLFRIRSAAAAVENSSWFTEFTNWEHVSRKLAEIGFTRRPAQNCREKFEEESAKYFTTTTSTTTTAINVTSPTPAPTIAAGDRIISNDCNNNNNNVSTVKNSCRVFCDLEDLYDHHADDDAAAADENRSYLHHHQQQVVLPNSDVSPTTDQTENENVVITEKQTPHPVSDHDGNDFQREGRGELEEEKKGELIFTSAEQQAAAKGKTKVEVDYTATGSEETHMVHVTGQQEELEDEGETEIDQGKKKKKKRKRSRHSEFSSSTDSYYEERFEMFKTFCEEMVRKMITHQEELHERILRDMGKQEEEKIAREEAWKKQEIERFEREMESRVKEHAMAVERQGKIIEFLNNFIIADESNFNKNNKSKVGGESTSSDRDSLPAGAFSSLLINQQQMVNNLIGSSIADVHKNPSSKSSHDMTGTTTTAASCDDDESRSQASNSLNTVTDRTTVKEVGDHRPRNPRMKKRARENSSTAPAGRNEETSNLIISNTTAANNQQVDITGKRWPREEVLALINVRCNIDLHNNKVEGDQNSMDKGLPLWERISRKMIGMGYKRSAKRCKEKWENINKYFRKTKDVKRKKSRCADSRTCPYFHQLSHLYSGQMVQGSVGKNLNVDRTDNQYDENNNATAAAIEDFGDGIGGNDESQKAGNDID